MATELQASMFILLDVFVRHTSITGEGKSLSKQELKELLQEQFCDQLQDLPDDGEFDKAFKKMDENKDDRVDFSEFCNYYVDCIKQFHNFLVIGDYRKGFEFKLSGQ